jgi:hypothetical protein
MWGWESCRARGMIPIPIAPYRLTLEHVRVAVADGGADRRERVDPAQVLGGELDAA